MGRCVGLTDQQAVAAHVTAQGEQLGVTLDLGERRSRSQRRFECCERRAAPAADFMSDHLARL